MLTALLFSSTILTTSLLVNPEALHQFALSIWPAQIVLIAIAGLTLRYLFVGDDGRWPAWILALFFCLSGISMFWLHEAHSTSVIALFGLLFVLQGLLWLLSASQTDIIPANSHIFSRIGMAGCMLSVFGPLFIAPFLDHAWWMVGIAGLAPTPTSLLGLSALFLLEGRLRWRLSPIPFAWIIYHGYVCFEANSMTWFILPLVAISLMLLMFFEYLNYWRIPESD